MSASNTLETGLLNLIFDNTDLANIGDATGLQGSTADGSLFVALYTSNPDEDNSGSETVYTNYARQGVSRTNGWTVSGNNASNAAAITFPQCGATGATLTHFAIFTAVTGGDMLFYGSLTSSLAVSNGITPEIAIGALDVNVE